MGRRAPLAKEASQGALERAVRRLVSGLALLGTCAAAASSGAFLAAPRWCRAPGPGAPLRGPRGLAFSWRGRGAPLRAAAPDAPGGPPMPSAPLGVARPGGGGLVRVELFLDLCCPFSARMFETVASSVAPQYESTVNFVLQPVAQPWHAQSSYMHEAALAVLDAAGPAKFWDFVRVVFAEQSRFFDDQVYDKTRREIYGELAELAASVGVDAGAVLDRLKLAGEGNAGSAVTQRLKWATKLHRTRGVHVTPTVHLNSLEAGVVGSGWAPDDWKRFLDYHVHQAR